MSTFGENLRAIRINGGYNQEKFSQILETNQATVSSWERGFRIPPLETIKSVANTLHVPLSSLISIQDSGMDEDIYAEMAVMLQQKPSVRALFDTVRYMSEEDISVLLSVANAIARNRTENE